MGSSKGEINLINYICFKGELLAKIVAYLKTTINFEWRERKSYNTPLNKNKVEESIYDVSFALSRPLTAEFDGSKNARNFVAVRHAAEVCVIRLLKSKVNLCNTEVTFSLRRASSQNNFWSSFEGR